MTRTKFELYHTLSKLDMRSAESFHFERECRMMMRMKFSMIVLFWSYFFIILTLSTSLEAVRNNLDDEVKPEKLRKKEYYVVSSNKVPKKNKRKNSHYLIRSNSKEADTKNTNANDLLKRQLLIPEIFGFTDQYLNSVSMKGKFQTHSTEDDDYDYAYDESASEDQTDDVDETDDGGTVDVDTSLDEIEITVDVPGLEAINALITLLANIFLLLMILIILLLVLLT